MGTRSLLASLSRVSGKGARPPLEPARPTPRYGYRFPPLEPLRKWFESERQRSLDLIDEYLGWQSTLREIPVRVGPTELGPAWKNDFLPPLDAVALYGSLAKFRPSTYLEVGSGNSTLFARKAISDHGLGTRIVSVDPEPRADVDRLCDEVIRDRLEAIDLARLPRLQAGDILFVDGSHCATTNSDVIVVMLELLPALAPGVIVQIHDIYLPYDYPPQWMDRNYSEQYLLAAQMVVKPEAFEVLLPGFFITHAEGFDLGHPFWVWLSEQDCDIHGESFWFRAR